MSQHARHFICLSTAIQPTTVLPFPLSPASPYLACSCILEDIYNFIPTLSCTPYPPEHIVKLIVLNKGARHLDRRGVAASADQHERHTLEVIWQRRLQRRVAAPDGGGLADDQRLACGLLVGRVQVKRR